jgi:hypothetical protein
MIGFSDIAILVLAICMVIAAVYVLWGCTMFPPNDIAKIMSELIGPVPISRISGYCHDPSRDYAYIIYRHESCAPSDRSISKAEWEANVEQRLRAYCARASDGALYRGESQPRACESGNETLTPDEWDKRREALQATSEIGDQSMSVDTPPQ